MYRSLDAELKGLDGDVNELPEIDAASLKEAYQTIIEIASAMDYEMMDEVLKSLKEYRLKPNDAESVKTIESLFTSLDWDGITGEAKKALK